MKVFVKLIETVPQARPVNRVLKFNSKKERKKIDIAVNNHSILYLGKIVFIVPKLEGKASQLYLYYQCLYWRHSLGNPSSFMPLTPSPLSCICANLSGSVLLQLPWPLSVHNSLCYFPYALKLKIIFLLDQYR